MELQNPGLYDKGLMVKSLPYNLDFQWPWKKKPFENIERKGENAELAFSPFSHNFF